MVLFNHSDSDFEVKAGDRIAQLICEKIYYPDLEEVQVNINLLIINETVYNKRKKVLIYQNIFIMAAIILGKFSGPNKKGGNYEFDCRLHQKLTSAFFF